MKAKPLVLKASHFMERPRILSWQNARSQLRHRLLRIISGHWSVHPMSALPPKVDVVEHDRDVRFVPKADIERLREKPAKAALVFEDRKRPHILTKDRPRKD